MSAPSRRSWRKSQGNARTAPSGAATDHDTTWQSRNPPGTRGLPGWVKLAAIAVAAALLAVLVIVLVVHRERRLPIIEIVVTGYDSKAIPPNAFAQEDSATLASANEANINHVNDDSESEIRWSKQALLEHLADQLVAAQSLGGPGGDAIVVYLSAHGALDSKAKPCLLPSDAEPLDEQSWLPLTDVLEKIRDKTPAESKKLLILDAGRLGTPWQLGQLYQGFADSLPEALETANVHNLYVLHSAGPGEMAWTAPELGGTVFGWYVARGFNGEADRVEKGGNGNGVLTLGELKNYVQDGVEQWVLQHRADRQRPIFLGPEDGEIPLASISRVRNLQPPATSGGIEGTIRRRYQEISQLWSELASASDQYRMLRNDPVQLAVLRQRLLRLEQLAAAGSAYNERYGRELDATTTDIEAIRPPPPIGTPVFSIPLSLQLNADPDADTRRVRLLEAWRQADGRPEAKEGETSPPEEDYVTTVRAALAWLNDRPITPERLNEVFDAVAEARGRPGEKGRNGADVVEFQLMALLRRQLAAGGGAIDDQAAEGIEAALSTRQAAESAAAPSDERVHYFVQGAVDAADRERRFAEDRLLGDETDFMKSVGDLGALESGAFSQAQDKARRLEELFHHRDLLWAEGPYLAQWLLDFDHRGESASVRVTNAELLRDLEEMIARGHQLANELDTLEPADDVPELKAYQAAYGRLREEFEEACDHLHDQPPRPAEIPRLTLFLRSPLVPEQLRGELLEKYCNAMYSESSEEIDHAAGDTIQVELPVAIPLAKRPPHALLEILRTSDLKLLDKPLRPVEEETSLEDHLLRVAREGGVVRTRLAQVRENANGLGGESDSRFTADKDPVYVRAGLSEADRLVRAAAPLLVERPWTPASQEPVHRLRRLDFHYLILWHCRRALDDFYARASSQSPVHYFDEVAQEYLQAAKRFRNPRRALKHGGVVLDQLRQLRTQAAEDVTIFADDIILAGSSQSAPQTLDVRFPAELPDGACSISLESPDHTLMETTEFGRHPWLVDVPSKESESTIKCVILLKDRPEQTGSDRFAASLRFRGHEFRKSFSVEQAQRETELFVNTTPRRHAEIVVKGDTSQRANVMFVFDCSGTMRGKMSNARSALNKVLEQLRKQGNSRVGLRVFGRRARWEEVGDELEKVFAKDVPAEEDLDPDTDTERCVRLQQLGRRQQAMIERELSNLAPFGQTPLYHTLITCLSNETGDFLAADPDEPRHILVVTDGVNQEVMRTTEVDEVRQAREGANRNVQISIILINREDIEERHRQRVQDLKELAKETGGTYHEPSDTESLIEELRKALRLAKYTVQDTQDPTLSVERHDLGEPTRIEIPGSPRQLEVGAETVVRVTPVKLIAEGGERFIIELRKDPETQLLFPLYVPSDIDPGDDIQGEERLAKDPVSKLDFRVQSLLPKRLGDKRVAFFVYVENLEEHAFTRRPKHIWAEIRPISDRGAGDRRDRVYHFYDIDLVDERPVPVMRFEVDDWPGEAPEAEISLWFTTVAEACKPETVKVDPDREKSFTVLGLDSQFTVRRRPHADGSEGMQVIVQEERKRSEEDQLCSVQISPRPARIERRLSEFSDVEIIQHTFDFEKSMSATVLVTPRNSILEATGKDPVVMRVRLAD